MSQTLQPLFGQAIVKYAIQELGRRATAEQIKKFLEEHYPTHSIIHTYHRALTGMIKRDEVTRELSGTKYSHSITYVLKE